MLVAALEAVIPKLMEGSAVPGLSIALVEDGQLLWRRAFGVRDNITKAPVRHETLFEAASVSKTAFAYAVMKLCENGVLNLDTPLVKYGAPPLLEGDPRTEQITARHVLSHTSGFQDFRSRKEPLKIHFSPGEKFLYSGEGYYYLQSAVTHLTGHVDRNDCAKYECDLEVCGTDIEAYLKRTLLQPFGMEASGYLWNDILAEHSASPHDAEGRPSAKKRPRPPDVARYGSCGGLHTSATEYAKFLIEIVNPKESAAFRLTRNSLDEMLRPQIKLPKTEKIDGADSWALGWAVQERKTGNVIVHSGGQAGFQSLTMASVGRKSGFIVLTNSDTGWKVFHNPAFGELMDRLLAGAA
jgi:CubicO group peptidase (beta-lactamase class C family)